MYPYFSQAPFRLTLAACALLCSAGSAWCQTSANVSLLSAYTARGVTLAPHPVAQVQLEYDRATRCEAGCEVGWYLGAFASPVRLGDRTQGQLMAYGGRSQRIGASLTWDASVSHSRFSRGGEFDYTEFHLGLMGRRSSVRLSYAPAYYGEGGSLYLDLNHSYPIGERWTLALHGGVLHPLRAESSGGHTERDSADLRLSLATQLGNYRFQGGVQKAWRPYHLPGTLPARTVTAGVSRQF
ncbi:MAG: TorF family putative porin [Gammaproteobacteria bacterium]